MVQEYVLLPGSMEDKNVRLLLADAVHPDAPHPKTRKAYLQWRLQDFISKQSSSQKRRVLARSTSATHTDIEKLMRSLPQSPLPSPELTKLLPMRQDPRGPSTSDLVMVM